MTHGTAEIIVYGYPGFSTSNGGLGWSTVGLVRTADRLVLIDTGPLPARALIRQRLASVGIACDEITDVVLTHCHHDHSINWPMFPSARVHLSRTELNWSLTVAPGSGPVPEFSMQALAERPATVLLDDVDEVAPGITTQLMAGHTPGSIIVCVETSQPTTLFLGDAAKNRAELLALQVDATLDADSSIDSLNRIWQRWREDAETVVVPGHDLPMALRAGECTYLADRHARLEARLGDHFDDVTIFDLSRHEHLRDR